jgi:hypothetical protein
LIVTSLWIASAVTWAGAGLIVEFLFDGLRLIPSQR